jgi:hypothetical protein
MVEISTRNIQKYNEKLASKEVKITQKQIVPSANILRNGMQYRLLECDP